MPELNPAPQIAAPTESDLLERTAYRLSARAVLSLTLDRPNLSFERVSVRPFKGLLHTVPTRRPCA